MSEEIKKDWPFKIKLKQSAKGFTHWEVSVKCEDLKELKANLSEVVSIAEQKSEQLNKVNV